MSTEYLTFFIYFHFRFYLFFCILSSLSNKLGIIKQHILFIVVVVVLLPFVVTHKKLNEICVMTQEFRTIDSLAIYRCSFCMMVFCCLIHSMVKNVLKFNTYAKPKLSSWVKTTWRATIGDILQENMERKVLFFFRMKSKQNTQLKRGCSSSSRNITINVALNCFSGRSDLFDHNYTRNFSVCSVLFSHSLSFSFFSFNLLWFQ